jgi:hypothetical protein
MAQSRTENSKDSTNVFYGREIKEEEKSKAKAKYHPT